jgi:pyrroline-5-carboxylate reductase
MTTQRKTVFLGAGNMAGALLRGAVRRAGRDPRTLGVSDIRPEASEALKRELGVVGFASNPEACRWADQVVLAVKPQGLSAVLSEIAGQLAPETCVISIVAGVPLARIESELGGHRKLVRAMPNTPALVGEGATALTRGPETSEAEFEEARQLFAATGSVVSVEEKLMDAVTGLSGSGPAYAFLAIEALSDGGVRAGLPREIATKLAAQTLLGAARLLLETGEHPGKLKDMVASPGGTTIAGIAALERAGFRAALIAAVEAATARSRELAP